MEHNKICFFLNYASHYRLPIYKLINDNLACDFYFGDKLSTPIKKIDYKELSNYKREFKRIDLIGNFYWLKGSISKLVGRYDVFVLTGEPYCVSNWLLMIYCKLFSKKTYLWGHGWYGRESRLTKLIKKMFYKLSSGLFLYGDYAKNLMIAEGMEEKKLIPIYNSLDYDKHLIIRQTLKATDIYSSHFKNEYPTLIYVGRIQKVKRIDMIFDAMEKLDKQGIHVNFVVVGDNTDIDLSTDISISDSVKKNVWLYGPCYDEVKLGELFYNAAVCVSPGNVGLTAIHSLSFGTPVITHNNFPYQMPEFEAIIEGKTGSFFKESDVDDLVDKIKLYTKINPVEREAIKEEGFKIIDERYNPYYQLSILKQVVIDVKS